MDKNIKDVKGFTKLEDELKLFDRVYKGFPYWATLRFSACESISGDLFSITNSLQLQRNGIKKKALKFFYSYITAIRDRISLMKKGKADLIIFRYGELSDRFFDTWELPKGKKAINIRLIPYERGLKKRDIYNEIPHYKSMVKLFFRQIFPEKKDMSEGQFLVFLENKLKEQFGQSITATQMEKNILYNRAINGIYKKYYKRIYELVQPKAIVFECYYTDILYPAMEVAKEKGIKVIELQHGVVSNHESYWFDDQRGVNNCTPDFFLTFGNMHNSWIKLLSSTEIVTIGYPWQQKMLEEIQDVITEEKAVIIYPDTSQEFELIIDRFINNIANYGYEIYIKVHPSQAKDFHSFYPILSRNKNARIIKSQNKSIYYWLKYGKHHIMASTTVGLEAMAFGHANIYICQAVPHDQTRCLIDWKVAQGFFSAEELMKKILEKKEINIAKRKKINQQLWKPDAKKNMEDFFSKLLM